MDDFIFHWNNQYASFTNFRCGKFIHSIIDKKFSEKGVNSIMIAIYVVAFMLLALNIGLTVSGGNYQI